MTATALRRLTFDVLKGIADLGGRVYDSRSNPLPDLPGAIPAVIVETPSGKALKDINTFYRTQTMRIVGVVEGASDELVAAASDDLEWTIWAALMQSDEWRDAWMLTSWDSKNGLGGKAQHLRGVVEITIVGVFAMELPDPSDLAVLREIRAAVVPTDLMDSEAVTPPPIETRVTCAGAQEQE